MNTGSLSKVNPIHQRPSAENEWYFWDETWAYAHGPFNSEEECKKALKEYAESL